MSRIPPDVVEAVYERARHGGDWEQCEACGYALAGEVALHHRKARAMGGTKGEDLDVAANLMLVHGDCHRHIHAEPNLARHLGMIVPRGEDFRDVAVRATTRFRHLPN